MKKKTKKTTRRKTAKNSDSIAFSEHDIRQQIDVVALIEALEDHVIRGAEMTSTQVSAALALLKKTLPDLRGSAQKDGEEDLSHEEALEALEQE